MSARRHFRSEDISCPLSLRQLPSQQNVSVAAGTAVLVILKFLLSILRGLFPRAVRLSLASCAILLTIFNPARLRAQATNPTYIAEMPSVDRVMQAMQASDPDETAARQMGAFWQLKTMIEEIAGPRYYKPGLTPEEAKLRQAYYTAYFQISQSKPQYKSFVAMKGYDVDPKFRNELIQKCFPPTFAAEYPKLMAQAKSQNQALHNQAEQIRGKQAAVDQAQAQKSAAQIQAAIDSGKIRPPTPPMSPEQRALNRCITSGRLPASCTGNSLLGAFSQMVGQVLPEAAKEAPPGPVRAGVFEGAGSWRLDFIDGGVLVNCNVLSPNQEKYKIEFKNGHAIIIVDTTPKSLVLTFNADGTIVGPGPLQIDGVIATGYQSGGSSYGQVSRDSSGNLYDSGGNRIYGNVNNMPGHATFSSKRVTCPALNLSSKGAGVGVQTMQTDLLKTMFGGEKGPPTPPGIRMHGIFAASTGFSVQFFPESAILGCGPDAARAYPYSVVAEGSSAAIKINAPDHPLTLTRKPDGSLDPGSGGAYQVHGRYITGKNNDDDFTFGPLEQTCNLSALAPSQTIPGSGGTAVSTTASAANHGAGVDNGGGTLSTPDAPLGNATLSIVSGFPKEPGAPNPLAGHPYVLLRDSYADIVAKAGVTVPAGTSPYKYVGTACASRTPECQKIVDAIKANAASAARADANGSATLPGVPPGTYYLMISARLKNQGLVWGQAVQLKSGQTSMKVDETNATPLN
jgi:hypothetical protein